MSIKSMMGTIYELTSSPITLWADQFSPVMTFNSLNNIPYNGFWYSPINAIGNSITCNFNLSPGSYKLNISSIGEYDAANVGIYIDNILIGTFDEYSASATLLNQSYTVNLNTYNHILSLVSIGKNVSSSAYYTYLGKITFIPLA